VNTVILEIAVVVLGILLLLADAFVDRPDKTFLANLGALGLGIILILSSFRRLHQLWAPLLLRLSQ